MENVVLVGSECDVGGENRINSKRRQNGMSCTFLSFVSLEKTKQDVGNNANILRHTLNMQREMRVKWEAIIYK